MPIAELREKYTEATGKRPFPGWKEDKLKELIDKSEPQKETLEQRLERLSLVLAKQKQSKLAPVHIEGKPYGIVGDEYVPWAEVELIECEAMILRYQAKKQQILKTLANG